MRGLELEFEDTFEGGELDPGRWLPYYLPHWSSRERAAARYEVRNGLTLRIDPDQGPWCPEYDYGVRVSSLQTGSFAGPLGSRVGQHRFHPEAVVREEQPELRLYTPQYGRFELRARASDDPDAMVALWMIGFEEEPEHSAEICVCEIFGRDVEPGRVTVGVGLHPFGDPTIVDDFSRVTLPIEAGEPHEYAAEWTPEGVRFFVDSEEVKASPQSPAYPLQLMLGIYAFPNEERAASPGAKRFVVERIRGYRLL